ncbi:hypothetical protein SAMN05421767_1346 [Granulicatella balaenopterae]|uniref:PTS cellobiose transporter subunit IIA n=1 Tax=Granulicatella balaenopterae TaxID=137733 RepID=A0A1H9N3T8_9LACT|nr:hypothetical protein [Granulicatella balaenopterae]SER30447.1 hypothetical protein SAMN05421767_1346 [Granulicatella balaenopterae]
MTKQDRKKQTTIKNMYFNRYLIFRYYLAGLFFCNLYWLYMHLPVLNFSIIFPGIMLVISLGALIEQVRLYGNLTAKVPLKMTNLFIKCQFLCCIVALISVFFNQFFVMLFPILIANTLAKQLIVGINMINVIILYCLNKRITKIKQAEDKPYKRLQQLMNYL